MKNLVLSLFPGIGLLDQGFEEAGFCVVRGPDLLWGGDVRRFHPPEGCFDGVIGGTPCQAFSSLAPLIRSGGGTLAPNLIPEFERIIKEAQPDWFVMENVKAAPLPAVDGYKIDAPLVNGRWLPGGQTEGVGLVQSRLHRFSFGTRDGKRLVWDWATFENPEWQPRVMASGGVKDFQTYRSARERASKKEKKKRGTMHLYGRADSEYFERAKRLQGLDVDFDLPGFKVSEKVRALGNAVPLPMARALAKAVLRALKRA